MDRDGCRDLGRQVVRFSAGFMQFRSLLRQVSSQTAFSCLVAEL